MHDLLHPHFKDMLCCVPTGRDSPLVVHAPPPAEPEPEPERAPQEPPPLNHLCSIVQAHALRGRSATETDLADRHYDSSWPIEQTLHDLLRCGGRHLHEQKLDAQAIASIGIEPLNAAQHDWYEHLLEGLFIGGLDLCRVRKIVLVDAYRQLLEMLEANRSLPAPARSDTACEAAFDRIARLYLDGLVRGHDCQRILLETLRDLRLRHRSVELACPTDLTLVQLANADSALHALAGSACTYFYYAPLRHCYLAERGAGASFEPSTQFRPYEVMHPGSIAAACQVMTLILRGWHDSRQPEVSTEWLNQMRQMLACHIHLPDAPVLSSVRMEQMGELLAQYERRMADCAADQELQRCGIIATLCCELHREDFFGDGGLTATALLQWLLLRRGFAMVQQTPEGLLSHKPPALARHLYRQIQMQQDMLAHMPWNFLRTPAQ
ncbi:hypothetical protein GT347_17325 [Xylophilus rhododendri]|uniref:Uncharacterized protein n=1 Tax=Xylophilus rhododendri TaxID=2697032 RepID=A0A857JA04_9BURK|nr:hypothetical protein [Xylophilus rhododendri]QHI99578.1 hypothetical protein GT347_17325 [Xylophilus rhododendri]